MINREQLLEGYNEKYNESFGNYQELLDYLYYWTHSAHRMGQILGLSHMTILSDLKKYNIKKDRSLWLMWRGRKRDDKKKEVGEW